MSLSDIMAIPPIGLIHNQNFSPTWGTRAAHVSPCNFPGGFSSRTPADHGAGHLWRRQYPRVAQLDDLPGIIAADCFEARQFDSVLAADHE
jgi:hypothetical protein